MIELTTEESKKALTDILVNIAGFCEKNSINYSLAYGTLIGAIRHKGFIPWDDDIDIIMMRDDYERFISIYKNNRYRIISSANQVNHSHIRISDMNTVVKYKKSGWADRFYSAGLWVDVFPIDRVPDTKLGYHLFRKSLWFLFEFELTGQVKRKSVFSIIANVICKPFHKLFGKMARKRMSKYNSKDTHTVANMGLWYLDFPSFPASYMNDFVDVAFEGHTFKSIKEYDSFLRGIYGDYMQYPPVEERKPKHEFVAYLKDSVLG